MEEIKKQEDMAKEIFRSYRESYIEETIQRVADEQEQHGFLTSPTDYVDTTVNQHRLNLNNYVCNKCNYVNPPTTTPAKPRNTECCPGCGHNPRLQPRNFDPYYRTRSRHPKSPPSITVGEPFMVNPNTKTNIKKVLAHVKEQSNMEEGGNGRKWTIVCADAIPYLIGTRLQAELYRCTICHEEVLVGMHGEHAETHPHQETTFIKMYGDILFRPGPAHIELNMACSLLIFFWVPLLSSLAKYLGFRTNRALEVVRNGVDHHRSRQILATVLEALSCELVLPCVREELRNNRRPTAQTYIGMGT